MVIKIEDEWGSGISIPDALNQMTVHDISLMAVVALVRDALEVALGAG